jgi:hypothetical protein
LPWFLLLRLRRNSCEDFRGFGKSRRHFRPTVAPFRYCVLYQSPRIHRWQLVTGRSQGGQTTQSIIYYWSVWGWITKTSIPWLQYPRKCAQFLNYAVFVICRWQKADKGREGGKQNSDVAGAVLSSSFPILVTKSL